LRTLLESKGASVREAPIPELHLPPEVEAEILRDLEDAAAGKRFKTWDQLSKELDAFIEERYSDG
ncbi:MAG: hypothetical protein ACOCZ8_04705, partial [Bacteroidota bacterium]